MRRSRIALVLPLLPALFAAGCESNPLKPEELAGEYVLQSVNGDPLPAATYADGTVSFHVLADTLRLGADGAGSQVYVSRRDWADPAKPDDVSITTSPLGYRLSGRRIAVTFSCPTLFDVGQRTRAGGPARSLIGGDSVLGTSCLPGPHLIGQLDGATLVISDGRNEMRYRRLEP